MLSVGEIRLRDTIAAEVSAVIRQRLDLASSPVGASQRFRPGRGAGVPGIGGTLAFLLAALCVPQAAGADETLSATSGQLVGPGNVVQAELPLSLSAHALAADPATQDVWVFGMMYENTPLTPQVPTAVRYGRSSGRGLARIVLSPTELAIPAMPNATYAMRGAVARSAQGQVLGVSLGDSKVYFFDARTLAPANVGALGSFTDLGGTVLAPPVNSVSAMVGVGTKIYAADPTLPVVAQIDLMAGTAKPCKVDSQPTGLAVVQGKVQVLTTKGTAQLADDCSATTAAAQGSVPKPTPATSAVFPNRLFELSDRVIDLTFRTAANATARAGVFVSLTSTTAVNLKIDAGTCKRTQFLAGDLFATPVAATQLMLSSTVNRLVLYASQTSPGEDCVALLTDGSGGEVALRIRGAVEGLGATVVMLDRSWSMERSFRGTGTPANADESRTSALRQGVAEMLGILNAVNATGPWAFLPFAEDAANSWATPRNTGFSSMPNVVNPDNANGMHVKGFAGQTQDALDPGGPSDLVQSLRSGLTRLATADTLPAATTGPARRLWILSDGSSGKKSYVEFPKLLPTIMKAGYSVRTFGFGSLATDPLFQMLSGNAIGLAGEQLRAAPRGLQGHVFTQTTLNEQIAQAMVRDVLRGRPVGQIARDVIQKGGPLSVQFTLSRDQATSQTDPWVLFVATWEHADAINTQLQVTLNNNPQLVRCSRAATFIVCAIPGQDGPYQATLTGERPGGQPEPAILRAFVSSAGPAGEVGFFPSFARAVYRSGDRVRVEVRLTERGLPLRLATVTARVNGPNAPVSTQLSLTKSDQGAISGLIGSNGDLTPGQAKAELLEVASLPPQKLVATLTLADDATGGDTEAQDGIYSGEFAAFIPGVYTVDVRADYNGLFKNKGIIEDRVTTSVIVGLDQKLTAGSVQSETISGGIRLRFVPQDSGKNLLGPGQGNALFFAQGSKFVTTPVSDYLDGSYRADVLGIDVKKPFDLISPAGRIELYNPGNPNPGVTTGGGGGCSTTRGATGGSGTPGALGLLLGGLGLLAVLRRRRPA